MKKEKFIKGTEDNYTHIKFYYEKGTMIVNAFTYNHVYPKAKESAIKFEYLIKAEDYA